MQGEDKVIKIDVVWRSRRFTVKMGEGASVGDLGVELQKLADVKAETLRLIVPRVANEGVRLVHPFNDEYRHVSLQEVAVPEGKAIRMMGVSEVEVDELLEAAKTDLRIAGFEEEERRLRLRRTNMPQGPIKLPQGQYIFCDFHTLQLPGIELHPPASEALKRMHMLAADPGIVAIMNKYRWQVGLMSEMAPIGYVGISPKCLLGLNKNQGEEISLRLRTDDLKGFRKYESIKKTLLHELAHMVYSEHDANFFALDRKLNEEAISLDWTKSQGRTVNNIRHSEDPSDDYDIPVASNVPHKLGGKKSEQLVSARASSVTAAYERYAITSTRTDLGSDVNAGSNLHSDSGHAVGKETVDIAMLINQPVDAHQNHPGVASNKQRDSEPDPDELAGNTISTNSNCDTRRLSREPDPDDLGSSELPKCEDDQKPLKPQEAVPAELEDSEMLTDRRQCITNGEQNHEGADKSIVESPHRNLQAEGIASAEPDPDADEVKTENGMQIDEPDPDDAELKRINDPVADVCGRLQKATEMLKSQVDHEEATKVLETLVRIIRNVIEHPEETKFRRLRKVHICPIVQDHKGADKSIIESPHRNLQADGTASAEPDPDADEVKTENGMQIDEPDPDDAELKRINDPVADVCGRLQKATKMLKSQVDHEEATKVLETLVRIIRNVIEHPEETKFRRLRKANPTIQRNITNKTAALDIFTLVGFYDDVVPDEFGRAEAYLVLKRNDPGLLWLAKSSLETCLA